ncbi:hypothetical protein C8J56DRAFT_1158662 [Mycena floridula]|nr:hypothetical protein C8J56DRAFT_1158662 [Mycena floridula]
MARAASRSAAITTEKPDASQNSSTTSSTSTTTLKKRKRSTLDSEDSPAQKQIKTEKPLQPLLKNAADVPLDSATAQNILQILEMIDSQRLLDRILSSDSNSSSSLRSLLNESQQHPLSALKAAVQHLLVEFSNSRASSSSEQLKFCNQALSLLNEASLQSVPIPLDVESLGQHDVQEPSSFKPKYSLVQHLPQGDYWTSLSSENPVVDDTSAGYSDVVAVFPHPSSSSLEDVPSLGSCRLPKVVAPKTEPPPMIPPQRSASTGSFLDYGPWTSFAPAFEQEVAEVGQRELSQVLYHKEMAKRRKEQRRKQIFDGQDVTMGEIEPEQSTIDVDMEGLLPPSEVRIIKEAMESLQLENAVQELLERNLRALQRLQELQVLRLSAADSGSAVVEEGSEEWDTAHGILDSLTLLASLRPRTPHDASSQLIPSPSALRTLQITLPLAANPGWHGTLPPERVTALRDDSTIKVRAGTAVPASTPATPAPAPAPAPVTASPSTFAGYTYNYGTPSTPSYRPAATAGAYQYKPATGSTSYSYTNQVNQASYYPTQQYAALPATGQQAYSAGWYAYPTTVAAASTGTGSGRGTPQPTTVSSNYQFAATTSTAATPPPQRTNAVANTVTGKPQWASYAQPQGSVPTLPLHFRPTNNITSSHYSS